MNKQKIVIAVVVAVIVVIIAFYIRLTPQADLTNNAGETLIENDSVPADIFPRSDDAPQPIDNSFETPNGMPAFDDEGPTPSGPSSPDSGLQP
ncbi:MAG: hypothetical protein A3H57_01835 [Candidatus Taylorbacteria bacterium RIFCSPLOWO2_02_FULL_43_11]|nr:MAG: hypothetical protein A2743_00455 [Candidatus Taylorbacteria bacterium RIFCSPHIGHO2_01_FULL_43_47]OHA30929.1 MAG: hypothetical protein A3B08_03970 [Candidatus Taylorbacteria bacterium RIFCSPLOWO2_01_FULL_43_44]OHA37617.1 MAG: hypothetical protein A3H57_01835 [Candidatus Taylorbacteria bacterium RIFCSPLOWO2_02_FULL_43_11]